MKTKIFGSGQRILVRLCIPAMSRECRRLVVAKCRCSRPSVRRPPSNVAAQRRPLDKGAPLVVLEAMKMEHTIHAPTFEAGGRRRGVARLRGGSAIAPVAGIVEAGPRDGLQNETPVIVAATKLELIHRLALAELCQRETTSFVPPQSMRQMADPSAGLA